MGSSITSRSHDPGEHDLGALPSREGGHETLHDVGIEADLPQSLDLLGLVILVHLGEPRLQGGVLLCQGVPVDVPSGHHLRLDLGQPPPDGLDVAVRASEDLAHGDVAGLCELLQISYPLRLLYELAGVRFDLTHEDAQEGGLPGAVDPYESDAVALVDLEADVLEDLDGAEGLGYRLGFEEHDGPQPLKIQMFAPGPPPV